MILGVELSVAWDCASSGREFADRFLTVVVVVAAAVAAIVAVVADVVQLEVLAQVRVMQRGVCSSR